MKLFNLFLISLTVAISLLGVVERGYAQGRVPINAANCESLVDIDPSCDVKVNAAEATGQHSYVTRNCDYGEGFICHVQWLPGMPTNGSVRLLVEWRNAGTGAFFGWVYLGCAQTASPNTALTWGTATNIFFTISVSSTAFQQATSLDIPFPTTIATDRYCAVKYVRAVNPIDSLGGITEFRALELQF